MKISSISVSNFKSYRDETISFGDLNILIGSNASGKSNTINILRFIDHIVDYGIENAISLSGGIEYVLNTSIGKSKPLSIAFSFDCEEENWIRYVDRKQDISLLLAGFDYQFQITPHKRGSGFTITQDSLCLKYYQVLDFVKGEKCITAADKQYMIRYRRSGNRVVADIKNDTDFLHSEDLRSGLDSDFITRYLSEQEHRKELILHFIMLFMPPMFYSRDLIRIYDFDPKLMKKSSSLTSISYLEEDGSNLANILQGLLKSKPDRKKLENLLKDCLPFVESISTESNFDKSVSYKIKEDYSQKPLYANFLSDGTVSILAMIVALHFEKNAGTIILEEPERNLHPYLMNRLLEMAREESQNRQIIMTTHTPELIKHADIDTILFAQRCEDGFTHITRPADNEMVKTFVANEVGVESLFVQGLLGG